MGAARLGLACLAAVQTFPGAAALFVDRNGIPCWPLDTVSRRGARLKGSTFSGAAFLRFPTTQRETCTHRNPVLHRRADHGTNEDQLPQGSENGLFPGITVENLTPILAPKVRDKRKREIETGLYSVFRKYAPGRAEMR